MVYRSWQTDRLAHRLKAKFKDIGGAAGWGLPGRWKWRGTGTYVEEGDLPSEKVDKLGVLRPLSLPWVGLGEGSHISRKEAGF